MLAVFVQRHNNVRYNNFSTDEFLASSGLIYHDSSVIIFNYYTETFYIIFIILISLFVFIDIAFIIF